MNTGRNNDAARSALKFLLCITSALVISLTALAQVGPTGQKKPTDLVPQDSGSKEQLSDRSFVEKAAAGGMAEVEISKLAVTKTTNAKIKKFATMMIKDHESVNAKLKQLATANRFPVPSTLSAEQTKMLAELQSLSGDSFDRAYVEVMKKDHDTTVGLFDNAAGTATLLSDLRVFANQTLPLLREHQKHAHALIDTKP